MNQQELTALMATLTGGFHTANAEEENALAGLQKSIAQVLRHQDPKSITDREFAFLQSDLFSAAQTGNQRLEKIGDIVAQTLQETGESDLRIFIRDTPVRSTQMAGSVPPFAAGARPVNTTGPIRTADGRNIFVDFFRVEKNIALYFQGQALPAILFNARFRVGTILLPNGRKVELTDKYTVIPTSVWVAARLLNASAPADVYCGLRVKSGTVQLTHAPQFVNDRLVLPANTQVSVNLKLEQKAVTDADETSAYGKDARAAELQLPEAVTFLLTATTKTIQEVAPAHWKIYGSTAGFTYQGDQNTVFNSFLNRLGIPLRCDQQQFSITENLSPFTQLSGSADIKTAWWALPAAKLDVANPLEADSNGALIVECATGLQAQWQTIQNDNAALMHPLIMAEPGRIGITDFEANAGGTVQHFGLWKDALNEFGTTIELQFPKKGPYLFNTLAKGDEMMLTQANADFKIDRPVKVNGEAVAVQSRNSALMLAATKTKHLVYLYDDNILWDNKLPAEKIPVVKPIALALHNALFTVTPPNGALLFGECNESFTDIVTGNLFLTFGLFSYLPTLPDPYTANLGVLRNQFERMRGRAAINRSGMVWMWLIGRIRWQTVPEAADAVNVSFHFAPLQQYLQIQRRQDEDSQHTDPSTTPSGAFNPSLNFFQPLMERNANTNATSTSTTNPDTNITATAFMAAREGFDKIQTLVRLSTDMFTLLDVSSNANQFGVSFSVLGQQFTGTNRFTINTDAAGTTANAFPIQVEGMNVVSAGRNVRAFALPQIAWEPVYNFTDPDVPQDPPYGWNYYPNDGLATRIGNLSKEIVPLSPIPLTHYLIKSYKDKQDNRTYAIFNLPFGMLALAVLNQQSNQTTKADITTVEPVFNKVKGGIQLELIAGSSNGMGEDNLFEGFTLQLANVNDTGGNATNTSTLGDSVTTIFHGDFLTPNDFANSSRSAVPVKRLGISGYGASMFSNWVNKEALFAQTSQALFNVAVGRTGHEVVQVKSMIYPWGIRVVRTITIFRLANGYVGRVDSGWKAESDGKFDFTYYVQAFNLGSNDPATKKKFFIDNPYAIHPGTIHGLFNVRNIREIDTKYTFNTPIYRKRYEYTIVNGIPRLISPPTILNDQPPAFEVMRGLIFDADVELEHVTEGGTANRVPSKSILGFVQLSPPGEPISKETFAELLRRQNGSIGGPINCVVKVAGSAQRMKLNRFDVNDSRDNANVPLFVGAARGSVVLPKDGSWSMVMHNRGAGDVTPIPESFSVPLIREGLWKKDVVVDAAAVANKLLRIAHPLDLVRNADDNTINFGFLQNLPTQKVLFLTPAFHKAQEFLLSKTPPLLADSYRLLNSQGIFPNIGKADGADFGTAIQLLKGGADGVFGKEAFSDSGLLDAGKKAFQLLQIQAKEEAGKLLDQGYKLIKDKANDLANEAFKFDLPSFEYPLVYIEKILKIYIEYKASSKSQNKDYVGKFDFKLDSFAADMADTWKGRFHNLAMVVDLGPMVRLMTVQGNFNSQKGKETDLGSKNAGDNDGFTLPAPEIKFSDELEPVIQILEILSQLSSGNYAEALKKGLKVAMSNTANIWEYKFEATKDIPLVRFPPGPAYEAPQTPLKLEASMGLGFYFNAALKVTTDPKQLLPTAGAFFQFHGGLQVMCVSVGVGTIYAVGHVDLKLAADTSPKMSLTMKFGFGAQLGVGLPVIGTVSILFMVGVEIYADTTGTVIVSAILLFRGHAELLGGLVGVTITIEAKGSVEKLGPPPAPTNCKAQVTFALDISIFLVIDISFSESWEEQKQIA